MTDVERRVIPAWYRSERSRGACVFQFAEGHGHPRTVSMCAACGQMVCNACSSERTIKYQTVRVCRDCLDE